MNAETDVFVKTENRAQIEDIVKLLKAMSEREQSAMQAFLQGVSFAETLRTEGGLGEGMAIKTDMPKCEQTRETATA